MLYISAGHHNKDSGAVSNGRQENKETIWIRDNVCKNLDKLGIHYIKDNDNETLKQYLDRIKTDERTLAIEFHFDASSDPKARGTTAVVRKNATTKEKSIARQLGYSVCNAILTKNRGVISEEQTARGSLGIMRESGIVVLIEICFISSKLDMAQWDKNKDKLAKSLGNTIANILKTV